MNKKTYQQPKMEVVQLDQADIIATSTGYNGGPVTIGGGGDGIEMGEEEF